MKNKKKLNIIVILLSIQNIALPNDQHHNKPRLSSQHQSKIPKQLVFQKNISLYKMLFLPSIISALCYANSKQLKKNIQENPLLFLIGSCVIFNFILDTSIKYKQINQTIYIYHLSKMINKYLLYALAIKNTMVQVSKKDSCCSFKEEEFFNMITKDIPLSFKELEHFIFNIFQGCIKDIQELHIKINTDTEAQIYLLCKEHITLDDVLNLYSTDIKLNSLLKKLQENPILYYKDAALELNSLIRQQFEYMIKHQPDIS